MMKIIILTVLVFMHCAYAEYNPSRNRPNGIRARPQFTTQIEEENQIQTPFDQVPGRGFGRGLGRGFGRGLGGRAFFRRIISRLRQFGEYNKKL